MRYYLAIDIGASSGRHLVGWLEDGRLVTEEIYRFANNPKPCGDSLTWDTEHLYREILNGLKRAGEVGKAPYSVAIDTWGVDYALLDENDELIAPVYCYRDSRTNESIPEVHKIIPFEELYAKTGIQYNVFNSVYQLYCDKVSGRMDKAASLLMLPNYFMYKLTGVKAQEYTNATTSGMINAGTREWDKEIIERLGYKSSLFTSLTPPSSELGEFTSAVEAFVGYKAKVTLPATHDTASAVVAAPIEKGSPYISSGTWSLLGVEEESAHTDKTALAADYSNEGGVEGTVRLQKNIMGLWMIQQVRHETKDKYSFDELTKMARESEVDLTVDVNEHRFLAPKSMTEEMNAATGRKLTLGECAFVIYDSLARSYAEALTALESITGKKYSTLNIIGGGSKNGFLNELSAKYTGKRIITGPTEGTAIGNLIMQMIGNGDIANVKSGREIVRRSFEINEI